MPCCARCRFAAPLCAALLSAWLLWCPGDTGAAGKKPDDKAGDKGGEKPGEKVDPAAVARARESVRLADDLYKATLINTHQTYGKDKEAPAAELMLKKIFEQMDKRGWHKARLVDATGKPLNKANAAQSAFEKAAVEKIKGGMPYYDEVATQKDGKSVLRAATVMPAALKQCASCHTGAKQGSPLGAIVYEVPIK
jgi:hypothetical protein